MGLSVERDVLAAAAGWDHAPTEAQPLLRTIEAPWFPGVVFPACGADGALVFYAAVSTPAEWRKLQPLLLAFVGATVTDFEGAPQRLDPTHPVEQALLAAGVTEAARLRPGRFAKGEQATMRALLRLVALLESAPDLAIARPEPTARLLSTLQDALNAGDLTEAWRIHGVLREESRLEAVNLLQLEMQILAAWSDWGAVRWHDRFETLALAEPSPATAEILLEAIYWTAFYDPSKGHERDWEEVLADPAVEFARLLLPVAPETTTPPCSGCETSSAPPPRARRRSQARSPLYPHMQRLCQRTIEQRTAGRLLPIWANPTSRTRDHGGPFDGDCI